MKNHKFQREFMQLDRGQFVNRIGSTDISCFFFFERERERERLIHQSKKTDVAVVNAFLM